MSEPDYPHVDVKCGCRQCAESKGQPLAAAPTAPLDAYQLAHATWKACTHEADVSGEVCLKCIASALARAHAEGLEAGLRQAAEYFDKAAEWAMEQRALSDMSISGAWTAMALTERGAAARIRSLIPAAPEVKDG